MRYIKLIIRIVFSVALLYFIFSKVDLGVFWAGFGEVNLFWIAAVVFPTAITIILISWRWKIVAGSIFGIERAFGRFVIYTMIGNFYSTFVPGGLFVSETMKGYRITKDGGEKIHLFVSQFLDRLTGIMALSIILVLLFLGFPSLFDNKPSAIAFIFALFSLVIGSAVLFMHLMQHFIIKTVSIFSDTFLTNLEEAYDLYKTNKKIILKVLMLAVFAHLVASFTTYFVVIAAGISVSYYYILWIYVINAILVFLPISYAGLGIREGVFVYFFGLLGVAPEQALLVSLLGFFVHIFVAAVGGGVEFYEIWKEKHSWI